jgi:hypothetical protein
LPEQEQAEESKGNHSESTVELYFAVAEISVNCNTNKCRNYKPEGDVHTLLAEVHPESNSEKNSDYEEETKKNETHGVVGLHVGPTGYPSGASKNGEKNDSRKAAIASNIRPTMLNGNGVKALTNDASDNNSNYESCNLENKINIGLEASSKVRHIMVVAPLTSAGKCR